MQWRCAALSVYRTDVRAGVAKNRKGVTFRWGSRVVVRVRKLENSERLQTHGRLYEEYEF